MAALLTGTPNVSISVDVYTDGSGPPGPNQILSDTRAVAVRLALVARNVPPSLLVAHGFGATKPIASDATPAGRERNRRVEIHSVR